jgi:hypothetical protein
MGYLLFLVYIAIVVACVVGMWKVFEKAGQPGWASIIPFYNLYILTCEIAKKEIMWFIIYIIPCTAIVGAIVVGLQVAKKFGKSEAYGIGLGLLPMIFYPMLGFGQDKYQG